MSTLLSIMSSIPDDHHLVLCALGCASTPAEGIHRWGRWQRIAEALDPLVGCYAHARLESLQVRNIVSGTTASGTTRITCKKAPTGGVRRWSMAANRDVATKYADAPDVGVLSVSAWAGSEPKTSRSGWDVYLQAYPGARPDNASCNQALQLCLSYDARTRVGTTGIEGLVTVLASAVRAIKLGATHRPWFAESPAGTSPRTVDVMTGKLYASFDPIAFRENPWAPWTELAALQVNL